jgi:hypothetical protein
MAYVRRGQDVRCDPGQVDSRGNGERNPAVTTEPDLHQPGSPGRIELVLDLRQALIAQVDQQSQRGSDAAVVWRNGPLPHGGSPLDREERHGFASDMGDNSAIPDNGRNRHCAAGDVLLDHRESTSLVGAFRDGRSHIGPARHKVMTSLNQAVPAKIVRSARLDHRRQANGAQQPWCLGRGARCLP